MTLGSITFFPVLVHPHALLFDCAKSEHLQLLSLNRFGKLWIAQLSRVYALRDAIITPSYGN